MTIEEVEELSQTIEDAMLKLGTIMHDEDDKNVLHEYEVIMRLNTPTLQALLLGFY